MSERQVSVAAEAGTTERILLIEDDAGLQRQMRWALNPHVVVSAGDREEALRLFKSAGPFRIVLLDLGLPPDRDGATEGLATLSELLQRDPGVKVIIASGNVDRANAVRAVAAGAYDFFAKPIDIDVLKLIIERGLRMARLEEENRALRNSISGSLHGMVFGSTAMDQVRRMIERVGPADVSVLVTGESGTGKEVVARALHEASIRRAKPFVAINCASIPENLLESELFGHERGAFTGAVKQTLGKFELADGGTLFLDEIGDMPLPLQAKMLRFLQERRFERVGGRAQIQVNVRLVSATNQPLEQMIADGKFREDLFYRLNEVRIALPPLRERDSDAVILAHHFLNIYNRSFARNVKGFSEDALAALAGHRWPGNVRELENRMKRAVVMSEGSSITAADLDLAASPATGRTLDLRTETGKLERTLLQEAIAVSGGNMSRAAKLLGVSRPQLYHLRRLREV